MDKDNLRFLAEERGILRVFESFFGKHYNVNRRVLQRDNNGNGSDDPIQRKGNLSPRDKRTTSTDECVRGRYGLFALDNGGTLPDSSFSSDLN
ncbi:hypothetical protein GWI33_006581 [Rhynchophorus ferrugineus]|uniref:Uncharacterized protein n=1 Tax=Rhynchophorus ferrugineus TaxID=354439 RepID=A0A834ILL4_RHYFE|nr:hypothetical protein GWI33_006581 [Rhynchophorus ferrugineus]